MKYALNGMRKIERSLDLLTLLRTQKRLITLERAVFDKRQLILSKISRDNYLSLEESGTESEFADHRLIKLKGYTVNEDDIISKRLIGRIRKSFKKSLPFRLKEDIH